MTIRIDVASGVPIYRQLVQQFKRAMASGVLREGDPLPSLRELSKELRINPLTIKRAYQELETAGLVSTQHGRGSFVSGNINHLSVAARTELLKEEIDRFLIEAQHLGFSVGEVIKMMEGRET